MPLSQADQTSAAAQHQSTPWSSDAGQRAVIASDGIPVIASDGRPVIASDGRPVIASDGTLVIASDPTQPSMLSSGTPDSTLKSFNSEGQLISWQMVEGLSQQGASMGGAEGEAVTDVSFTAHPTREEKAEAGFYSTPPAVGKTQAANPFVALQDPEVLAPSPLVQNEATEPGQEQQNPLGALESNSFVKLKQQKPENDDILAGSTQRAAEQETGETPGNEIAVPGQDGININASTSNMDVVQAGFEFNTFTGESRRQAQQGAGLGTAGQQAGQQTGRSGASVPSFRSLQRIKPSEITYLGHIGSGSFGAVYKAEWEHCEVAVKMPLMDQRQQRSNQSMSSSEKQLLVEIARLAHVDHVNTMRFLGVVEPDKNHNLEVVTEYYHGGSLYDLIEKADTACEEKGQVLLSWLDRLHLLQGIAAGMAYLHKPPETILHGDLRPPNVLLSHRSTEITSNMVKIADFGSSQILQADKNKVTLQNTKMPMLHWCAPEKLEDNKDSAAADMYSFGIIMWQLLTFKNPFHTHDSVWMLALAVMNGLRPTLPSEASSLPSRGAPPEYVDLMQQCWAQDPEERPRFEQVHQRVCGMVEWARSNSPVGPSKDDSRDATREIEKEDRTTPVPISPRTIVRPPVAIDRQLPINPPGAFVAPRQVLKVRSGFFVDAISLEGPVSCDMIGGTGGSLHIIKLHAQEYITKIKLWKGEMIDRIVFETSNGRTLGPYGTSEGGDECVLEPSVEGHVLTALGGAEIVMWVHEQSFYHEKQADGDYEQHMVCDLHALWGEPNHQHW